MALIGVRILGQRWDSISVSVPLKRSGIAHPAETTTAVALPRLGDNGRRFFTRITRRRSRNVSSAIRQVSAAIQIKRTVSTESANIDSLDVIRNRSSGVCFCPILSLLIGPCVCISRRENVKEKETGVIARFLSDRRHIVRAPSNIDAFAVR
ncbi:hypothetical protein GHT06_021707 [Daphnia sinensis]|uniref:Uncharacterized protein n=1 Tax=Daphnia sinensis TaxID=1820382 RepID=A0AAD5L5G7_9CRUS|nr:hypothetical protein GHT06_021707 [Daphnia sinensis]